MSQPVPTPSSQTAWRGLQAMLRERHLLAALQVFHAETGDVFRIQLPGFSPVVMAGPEAARFVLVSGRDDLRWRTESDPVTGLLRHGVLVEDGESHDALRRLMSPSLHRRMLEGYLGTVLAASDEVTTAWQPGRTVDMLVEMRKIALLALTRTLFEADIAPEMRRLWDAILGVIAYISPGLWMLWPGAPRPGARRAIQQLDAYLYRLIAARRAELATSSEPGKDLLSTLLAAGLDDDLVRDQLLTMLIAGHDTSTALLSWALYMLARHPSALRRLQEELDGVLAGAPPSHENLDSLPYLERVIYETLRLYPPIHLGSRVAAIDLDYNGYLIPAGERVIYSIYLTQRHPAYWDTPNAFCPERHPTGSRPAPYTWLAFGGGPRNCIGAAFGQMEALVVLARVLQNWQLGALRQPVHLHMGATLEPRPGVRLPVYPRRRA